MKIEFVNHSSYVVDTHGVRIIFDPWIEGKAFNNGWDQISKTRFTYDDFHDVTHIWFSHEHPDHFSPANIKKIPEAFRKNSTVLFQTTRDKNVVNFCRKLGFKEVIELDQDHWFELAPDLQFLCYPFHTG